MLSDITDILLIISRNRLSVAQPSSSFKRLDTRTFTYVAPTHNLSTPSCYSSTAVFNDCYSELTPYTVIAGDQWVKSGDWELEDHMIELCCFDEMGEGDDAFSVSLKLA